MLSSSPPYINFNFAHDNNIIYNVEEKVQRKNRSKKKKKNPVDALTIYRCFGSFKLYHCNMYMNENRYLYIRIPTSERIFR